MAEKRKFSALAELRAQSDAPAEVVHAPEPPPPPAAPELPEKGRGRPATGKRSNPEYKLYAHYLKKRTLRQVTARLAALHADNDHPPDLSDLMQELLEGWLEKQSG